MADAGFPQVRSINNDYGEKVSYVEKSLITTGDDVNQVRPFLKQDKDSGIWSYSAADVVDYLVSAWEEYDAQHELKNANLGEKTEKMKPVLAIGEGVTDPNLGM
eukprot:CAMPEP_0195316280 /NCGR_PEP_ID=MMETSP0708-20121125/3502_1 /TAXON_ID=33640 /ORGANISM="Asterionellopsis glacialis, Strain CCMP134" /LENGTH=103 /DNA_ID=CAMNT_0040381645 /DNA_START=48 /DNA_END=359 /DNA_ORIENTATION=+